MNARQKLTVTLLLLILPLLFALPVYQAGISYQLKHDIHQSYRSITMAFDEARVRSAAAEADSQFAQNYFRGGPSSDLAAREGGRYE